MKVISMTIPIIFLKCYQAPYGIMNMFNGLIQDTYTIDPWSDANVEPSFEHLNTCAYPLPHIYL